MEIKIGNLFNSNCKTLVNTVNCVGIMGKGVALDFKNRYPQMYKEYVTLCRDKKVKPGVPYYYSDLCGVSIINFPTKDHWRSPSKLSYIVNGLKWFRKNYIELGIESVAFPPLGCGNGGLPWTIVGPIIFFMLHDLPIKIEVYAPYGTPKEQLAEKFLIENLITSPKELLGNKSVSFNKYWLFIPYIVQKLNQDKYSLSVGRTIFQKVCFVLTRVGIPTGFNFVERSYGPYAEEVKDAITVLSNANIMTEQQFGRMIKTVVSSRFEFPKDEFTHEELEKADKAFDLLSRIKSTDHAEMIATVLFSYDELESEKGVTEKQIYDHIVKWKPRWKETKSKEIINTINSLSILGWITPDMSKEVLSEDEDFF